MSTDPHRPSGGSVAVAITGASGAVYATRTLAALLTRGMHVELVVTDYGRRLLRDELGEQAVIERMMPYLSEKYGPAVGMRRLLFPERVDLGNHLRGRHHISQVQIDVQQVHFVQEFAPFPHGFLRHDDPDAVSGVATGGINAVAGADAGDDQRVDAE